jgi:hypothetical protein
MTPIKWTSIRKGEPLSMRAIMVRDHEKNCSPGFWNDKFVAFLPIPIGVILHWTYIRVVILPLEKYDIIDAENIMFENGSIIKISEIYDFEDPVKIISS